jgi:hypothetical protein
MYSDDELRKMTKEEFVIEFRRADAELRKNIRMSAAWAMVATERRLIVEPETLAEPTDSMQMAERFGEREAYEALKTFIDLQKSKN